MEDADPDAEARLWHSYIVGTVAEGNWGPGCYGSTSWARKLVVREVRKAEEE